MAKPVKPTLWRLDSVPDAHHSEVITEINRQMNTRLQVGRSQRRVIKHNLEAGLIAEAAVRELLAAILPRRFGVAKGKLVDGAGKMSKHLDVIIYDVLNYPTFFIDGNHNQILPIEAALVVMEVKSRTSHSILKEAFDELQSVASLHYNRNCSTNDFVDYFPPALIVFSFEDMRSLKSILDSFLKLNALHPVKQSFSRYSKKSPGSRGALTNMYMVYSVIVAGKGSVFQMLDGKIAIGEWGEHTVGLEVSSLIDFLLEIKLPKHNPREYLSWITSGRRHIYSPGST